MTGKNVLIIGNGFDLDLGYLTKYSDFANSLFWPFHGNSSGLEEALVKAIKIDKWYDIEGIIEQYATRNDTLVRDNSTIAKDKETFSLLCSKLQDYLRHNIDKKPYFSAYAEQVLTRVIDSNSFVIYTFNYTPLDLFASFMGIERKFEFNYVHGNLESGIILGVREEAKLRTGYDFLRKTFSHKYQSNQIPYDLQEADNVIFFGHSLSQNDAHYFKSFFKGQMQDNMTRDKSKNILFFTCNEDSELAIKRQLSTICDGRLDLLYNHNDIHFILTSDVGNNNATTIINEFFDSITISNSGVGMPYLTKYP